MFGWSILLVILFVILVILFTFEKLNNCDLIGSMVLGFVVVSIFIIVLLVNLEVKQQVNQFDNYQEMVNEIYTNGEIEDAAINSKIIDLNKWLADANGSVETFGIFSLYRGKIEKLEYIKLIKEE